MTNIVIHPVTKQKCSISNSHPKIGDFVVQESGEVAEVKSLAQLETLVDRGAKLIVPITNAQISAYVYPGIDRAKLS
jgi:hypothetical protein